LPTKENLNEDYFPNPSLRKFILCLVADSMLFGLKIASLLFTPYEVFNHGYN
jgi:hypothetical protein